MTLTFNGKPKYTLIVESNNPQDILDVLRNKQPDIPEDFDLEEAVLETIEPDPIKVDPILDPVAPEDIQLLCKQLCQKRGSRTPVNTILDSYGFTAVSDITPEKSGEVARDLKDALNA